MQPNLRYCYHNITIITCPTHLTSSDMSSSRILLYDCRTCRYCKATPSKFAPNEWRTLLSLTARGLQYCLLCSLVVTIIHIIIMCNAIVRAARIENRIYCFAYILYIAYLYLYSMLITITIGRHLYIISYVLASL